MAAVLAALAASSACGNQTARAPNPTGYRWPDAFSYELEYVAQTSRDSVVLARYEERKTLRLVVRDDRYVVWHDSVSKVTFSPGAPPSFEPYWPEDTLHYYIWLGRLGDLTRSEPGCDPAVTECAEALPSALPLELRRIVPRLPVWWPPRGFEWEDTLAFDDLPRARGARGTVVTRYRSARDTVIRGSEYWIVEWWSTRRAYGSARGGAVIPAELPAEESGAVLVDKQRLLPAFASWVGAVAAPVVLRAEGVAGTGFRGRAYLVGSVFDSILGNR